MTAIVLATRAPVLLAPSMNVNMWNHPLTQANLRRLVDVAGYRRRRPGRRLPRVPVDGPGPARRARRHRRGRGARAVAAGSRRREASSSPRARRTRRSIRCGSSAIAAPARWASRSRPPRSAAVPTSRSCSARARSRRRSACRRCNVETAAQLQWALGDAVKEADVVVMTAAVADYRPAKEAKEKLKRGELGPKMTIDLVANPDLLAELGKKRRAKDAAARRVRGRDRGRDRERAGQARDEEVRPDRRERRRRAGRPASRSTPTTSAGRCERRDRRARRHRRPRSRTASSTRSSRCCNAAGRCASGPKAARKTAFDAAR